MEHVSLTLNWRHALPGAQLDSIREFLMENGGIYLWVYGAAPGGIHYIGETNCFLSRMTTHCSSILSGFYESFNVQELEKMDSDQLVEALNAYAAGSGSDDLIYTPDPERLSDMFFDEVWGARHREYLNRLLFAFATLEDMDPPLDLETDMPVLRKEIEAALIISYKRKMGIVRKAPIGQHSRIPKVSYEIHHSGSAAWAVPDEIQAIRGWRPHNG